MILKFDTDGNFEDWVVRIADKVKVDNYRKIIKTGLKNLGEPEIKDVVDGLNKILKVLKGDDDQNVTDSSGKNPNPPIIQPGKETWLTDKLAAEHLGVSLATFYRRIKDKKIKKYRAGGNVRYKYDDIDRIFSLMLKSASNAYCINNCICVDKKKREVLPFEKGTFYSITDENKIWVYLYNDKWCNTIKIGKKQFRKNFSVKGEIEYDAEIYIG